MAKEPDLYELLAQQARYERPRSAIPAHLRGELPERTRQPQQTYSDPTSRKAVANAEPRRKRRRRRRRKL